MVQPILRIMMAEIKYVLFVGLCVWALGLQLVFRVAGDALVPLLPWIGIGLGAISSLLFLNYFLIRVPTEHPIRRVMRWVDWAATAMIALFVGYGLFLYANATMVQSTTVTHQSQVLSISGPASYRWAALRSWEEPGGTTNVLITSREDRQLWGGETVLVHVREGAFGKPWVTRIEQDHDHYAREVLKLAPTAARAWRDLIKGHLARKEWTEAAAAGRRYLEVYPADYSFVHNMGTSLVSARHANDRIFFLEHIMSRHPNYEDAQLLGFAYLQAGQSQKAADVYRAAIPLRLRDWEAYYHLGLIDLEQLGNYEEAVALFDEVLTFVPGFPMIERYRDQARQKLEASREASSITLKK